MSGKSIFVNSFVIDTSVWVSIAYNSKLAEVAAFCIRNKVAIYASPELLKEINNTFHKPEIVQLLKVDPNVLTVAIAEIYSIIETRKAFSLLTDYKDNFIVDIAIQTKSIIVTQDKGFNVLRN